MLTILGVLAGVLVEPKISPDFGSYPSEALRRRQSAAALVEFVVDPEGQLVSCDLLAQLGEESLSREVCKLQRQARFEPAKDEFGTPSYGIVRAFIKYVVVGSEEGQQIYATVMPGITHEVIGTVVQSGSRPPDFSKFREESGPPRFLAHPDIDLEVQALPETSDEPFQVQVTVAIGPEGGVTQCSESEVGELSRYGTAAYQQLLGVKVGDSLIVDGEAVPFIRPYVVQFVVTDV
uniref:TonB family protein n=1 Tax=uncultured Altererythrobacter sp. TaxID=500840 RepID=UPI0026083561|nr:TonB family protein [uncultured Altererythrobacter sp.]